MQHSVELFFIIFVIIYSFIITHIVPRKLYSFVNIILSIGAIIYALIIAKIDLSKLGFSISAMKYSLLIGAIICIPLVICIIGVSIIPKFQKHFYEVPAKNNNLRVFAYEVLFRIPFGTAFSEEIIFRSVLLSILLTNHTSLIAIIISSVCFGFWHIFPTLKNLESNDTLNLPINKHSRNLFVTIGSILITSFAGIVFAFLTLKTQSFIASWMVHSTINGIPVLCGYILVWLGKNN